MTYPEALFTEKVGVPRPRPQSSRHKSPFGIPLCPGDLCSKPFVRIQFTRALERLVRVLLVVCNELHQHCEESKGSKSIIRDTQRCVWLGDCNLGGDTEEKENDILNHS